MVDHEALAGSIRNGRIAGAAVDVFPNEPEAREPFTSPLQNLPNVILTPHIGGSTEEAQQNIGQFVSSRLVEFLQTGNTMLTVNLPHRRLAHESRSYRLTHIHQPELRPNSLARPGTDSAHRSSTEHVGPDVRAAD